MPRAQVRLGAARRPSVAILVPAHNEVAVITDTLSSITPQLAAGDRLLVVADNCSDETAEIASHCGAEVVIRQNDVQRGKGYALDCGIRHLEATQPPEVVIIVDADCEIGDGSIDGLVRQCVSTERPVQALYLMYSPSGAGLKMHLAEFAWRVKNLVRPLGASNLGMPCQLMGTGMAFPWELVKSANLANASIVEDMQLGIDLALDRHPPLFFPDVTVSSVFPEAAAAEQSQRTRWEHGHLTMIVKSFPTLFAKGLFRGDVKLLGLAMDLSVPPVALLVLSLVALCVLALVAFLSGASVVPLSLAGIELGMLTLSILLAWYGWGRDVVTFSTLLSVPFYVLAKIPLYLKFLIKRQQEWVRTERK
jgi:cellulose synthase/poly-beta-1,6-N-acetylglucosamine synthase-like glycosyltransferase